MRILVLLWLATFAFVDSCTFGLSDQESPCGSQLGQGCLFTLEREGVRFEREGNLIHANDEWYVIRGGEFEELARNEMTGEIRSRCCISHVWMPRAATKSIEHYEIPSSVSGSIVDCDVPKANVDCEVYYIRKGKLRGLSGQLIEWSDVSIKIRRRASKQDAATDDNQEISISVDELMGVAIRMPHEDTVDVSWE